MLKLRYRRAGETEARPRKLGPLGLVLKAGVWYLVAQSGKRSAHVSRGEHPRRRDHRRAVRSAPKHFDLAAHWEKAVREYEAGVYHEHADVRLSPQGVYMLDLLGPYVQREAARTAGKPDRRGWVRCTLPLESIDFGIRELMRLGDEVIVLGPPELRAKFAQAAARMARTHGDTREITRREARRRIATRRLAERERERLDAGIEKFDLERAIADVALDAQRAGKAAARSPRRCRRRRCRRRDHRPAACRRS